MRDLLVWPVVILAVAAAASLIHFELNIFAPLLPLQRAASRPPAAARKPPDLTNALETDGAASASSSANQTECYGSPPDLKRVLPGAWRQPVTVSEAVRLARYWNFSCPFEWGKYSCVFQGSPDHAREAMLGFHPASGCSLREPDSAALARVLRGRRLILRLVGTLPVPIQVIFKFLQRSLTA